MPYCRNRNCYKEPYNIADNSDLELCKDHWDEFQKKKEEIGKIDYSKLQNFKRRSKKSLKDIMKSL